MGRTVKDGQTGPRVHDEKPCRNEVLEAAFSGALLNDQYLERIFDRLERRR